MKKINDELKIIWQKEEEKNFSGWDFSYLENKWKVENLPWDYKKVVKKYLSDKYNLLDMGTGGGELFLSFNHPYNKSFVTEGYEPNFKLCLETLAPLGVNVKQVFENNILDFSDNFFDIIINRHEEYKIEEVKRVLKPNGIFITQQVGGKNGEILSNKLIKNFKPKFLDLNLENSLNELKKNNFEILYSNKYFPYLRFLTIEGIIYYCKIITWEFPNFSVENNFQELLNLQKELEEKKYIETKEDRFILVSKNLK